VTAVAAVDPGRAERAALVALASLTGIGPATLLALHTEGALGAWDALRAGKGRNVEALAQEAVKQLARLVDLFDQAATPYLPRVQPFSTDSAGDYDHLARVREWSASGGDGA